MDFMVMAPLFFIQLQQQNRCLLKRRHPSNDQQGSGLQVLSAQCAYGSKTSQNWRTSVGCLFYQLRNSCSAFCTFCCVLASFSLFSKIHQTTVSPALHGGHPGRNLSTIAFAVHWIIEAIFWGKSMILDVYKIYKTI